MHLLAGLPVALALASCSEGLDVLMLKEQEVTNLIANGFHRDSQHWLLIHMDPIQFLHG